MLADKQRRLHLVPTLLAFVILAFVAGCPTRPSDTVAATTPNDTPHHDSPEKPQDTLEGDYIATHEAFVYAAETDESVFEGETRDMMSIRNAPEDALHVRLEIVGYNYDICFFEGTMKASGPNQWRYKGRGSTLQCELTLVRTSTAIVITSNWDCYRELCGNRATLEGTFLLNDRKPPGSIEWQER